jgi:hypothetical protein
MKIQLIRIQEIVYHLETRPAEHRQLNAPVECETMQLGHHDLMTKDQEKLALHLINKPPPGSELAKAKEFGVDLTLFISTLRRSPTERARCLSEGARIFQIAKQTRPSEK